MTPIGFNKPYLSGKELTYMQEAIQLNKISGDGFFTEKCHHYFESNMGFKKVLLTTSCTDALEMAALLLNIQPGDEVIAPVYTFVSTVNAFVLRGAKIVFVDSCSDSPNMDAKAIEPLISLKTKAIIAVHYAGIACEMNTIMALAEKHNLFVVEDAAHAIDSYYENKRLGSFGHVSTFSFHETKNIISGEGGMLVINHEPFIERAEIIREKGTNRSKFARGEVNKYTWVDLGSSFLPSDLIAAYLFAQLENIDFIQQRRMAVWNHYNTALQPLKKLGIQLPHIPHFATNNAHMFYLVCQHANERTNFIKQLQAHGIQAVFHYLSLNKSPYYRSLTTENINYVNADRYSDCLVRLPLYVELTPNQLNYITETIKKTLL